jgi:hypothetical protein
LVYLVVVVVELSKKRMNQDPATFKCRRSNKIDRAIIYKQSPAEHGPAAIGRDARGKLHFHIDPLFWPILGPARPASPAIVPLRLPPPNDFHLSRAGNPCRATGLLLLLAEDLPHDLPKSLFLWSSSLPSACHRPSPVDGRLINALPLYVSHLPKHHRLQ